MNTRTKGNRIEREFQKHLEELGFETHKASREAVFIGKGRYFTRQVDIYGRWDIIARNPKQSDWHFHFQVSADWKYGRQRKKLTEGVIGMGDLLFMVRKLPRKPFELMYFSPKEMWVEMTLSKFEKLYG